MKLLILLIFLICIYETWREKKEHMKKEHKKHGH